MAENPVYPSVFVVDGQAKNIPFVPPHRRNNRHRGTIHMLLGVLVMLALAGVAIEAFFLMKFRKELDSTTYRMVSGEVNATYEKFVQERKIDPEKPAAHLRGANFTTPKNGPLLWEHIKGDAFINKMDYQDGALIIRKTGYYFVYSKVIVGEVSCNNDQSHFFKHSIIRRSEKYPVEIPLMVTRKFYCTGKAEQWLENSFLGGVFYLEEKDRIYVNVFEKHLVRMQDGTMSYFGAFML
uniref:Tumor necrosis factor ligand superfamily member 6 n=1 Tax=Latimeria chalumnae TaxID=7897 RepID=H3BBD1_LATCH